MLIPMADLVARYDVRPEVVCHVGAHLCQEAQWYSDAGATDVLWIEANPAIAERARVILADYPGHRLAEACLSATEGERVTFHITEANDGSNSNQGMSSSILDLGTHRTAHPEVVVVDEIELTTTTLDTLVATEHADLMLAERCLLALDCQGAEGLILQGAEWVLSRATWVYWEANLRELYRSCMLFPEVDALLVAAGFETVELKLAGCQRPDCSDGGNRAVGWGDAASVRVDNPRPFSETHPEMFEAWYP